MTEQENNVPENNQTQETATGNINDESILQELEQTIIIKEKDERIATLEAELQLAKKNESEAMIRARAEIDNVRRRVEQDVEKAHKFALEKFANELLPVIDNLERALEVADKTNPEYAAMVEGLTLTLKSFLDAVKKFGIDVIETENSQLNPDVHQAIQVIESPDHQSGQIVNTIQKGYSLNGRLIRPAMVIVAK